MTVGLILIGALVGLAVSEAWLMTSLLGDNGWLGLLFGGLIGALWARLLEICRRLDKLEVELQAKSSMAASTAASDTAMTSASAGASTGPADLDEPISTPSKADEPPLEESRQSGDQGPASNSPAPASTPKAPAEDSAPPPANSAAQPAYAPRPAQTSFAQSSEGQAEVADRPAWSARLWGGNLPVRIGVLVSLIGIAALLRYAVEQGWLAVPIEARLALVAVVAIIGLAFGWRQRFQRRAFALSIQGGAIGVLLMVVFAAYRLYDVAPMGLSFVLSITLVAGAGLLAVLQNARWLAILGMIAGFASPLIIGDGQQGPTGLFAWYSVLNLGVFGVAWWKRWPLLNRIGFSFTFIIGSLWGYLAWSPDHYQPAQLFLLLFCALYFLIPIFEARRSQRQGEAGFDALLVFSLPLVALPLQAALAYGDRVSIASAAFIGSIIYLLSALLLIKRWDCAGLGRAHAVIAIALATLAVPFAFSGPTVVMVWALQGAALVWYGCQSASRLVRWSGLLLQLTAGSLWLLVYLLSVVFSSRSGPISFTPELAGALALTVAGLVSAAAYERAGAGSVRIGFQAAWGLAFWLLGGVTELQRHLDDAPLAAALIGFFALTVMLAGTLYRWLRWPVMGFTPGLMMVFSALILPEQLLHGGPLAGGGLFAWAGLLAAIIYGDRQFAKLASDWRGWHALAGHGAAFAMLSVALGHHSAITLELASGWTWLAGASPLLVLTCWLLLRDDAPLARRPLAEGIHDGLLALSLLVITMGLLASLVDSGSADPLPWLPVLNPLELAQALAVLILLFAARGALPQLLPIPMSLVLGTAFLVITTMTLRGSHQLGDIDWQLAALWREPLAQAALTVTWTTLGMLAWVLGSKRGHYSVWLGGALLLALVLTKLLLVDRSYLSTVAGILSFLAFGALSIAIGYLAPAPPRRQATTEFETEDTTI